MGQKEALWGMGPGNRMVWDDLKESRGFRKEKIIWAESFQVIYRDMKTAKACGGQWGGVRQVEGTDTSTQFESSGRRKRGTGDEERTA